jgi:hypothetical protein
MRLWLVLLLAAFAAASSAQSIRLSTSPFAAHYCYLRAATEPGSTLPPGALGAGVNELAKLESTFPDEIRTRTGNILRAENGKREHIDALYWRTIDAFVLGASSLSDLNGLKGRMPETIGGYLSTRNTMDLVTSALQKSRTAYETRVWPGEQAKLDAQTRYWREHAQARSIDALRWIAGVLGITDLPATIDVVLVPQAAGKEGMTLRRMDGLRVVIGAGKYQEDAFAEVVLHESLHVIDIGSPGKGFLADLRAALKGAKRSEFEIEQVPHAAMFVLAAEATRRYVLPEHKDVGETHGAYERGLEPLRKIVAPELAKLIEGAQTREAAVAAIVRALPAKD